MHYLECISPLAMEGNITRIPKITTSTVTKVPGAYGLYIGQINYILVEWCPDTSGGKITERSYDQYIEIDLLNLAQIIGIATHGREYNGAAYYAKDYKISYRKDGEEWYFYQEKDQTEKVKI